MFREDRELLADLKRVCNDAGLFALEYMAGDLSIEAEDAYARRLIDICRTPARSCQVPQGTGTGR